jgi:hypothetical protein
VNFDRRNAIPGAGIDADPTQRPGVPMETAPRPVGAAHWEHPPRQQPRVRVYKRAELDQLTPVFSNAVPPRGVSGFLRGMAYQLPEHRLAHWALLLLADRVDVLEGRVMRSWPVAVPLAIGSMALSMTALAWSRMRRRPRVLRVLGI